MDDIYNTTPTNQNDQMDMALNRQRIMRRFETWLDEALASEPEPGGLANEILASLSEDTSSGSCDDSESVPQNPCDLYSIWCALTTTTQEVKLQGRAFKRLSDALAPLESLDTAVHQVIEAHAEALSEARRTAAAPETQRRQREEEIRLETQRATRRETLETLLNMRDRLERGIQTASQIRCDAGLNLGVSRLSLLLPGVKGSLQAIQDIVAALEQGYMLSLDNIGETLERFGVRAISCLGTPLNPGLMKVIDIEETTAVPEGTVVEVYRPGYTWNGSLFRPAEVKVAREGRKTK